MIGLQLVVGGAGFIGSSLVRVLVKDGPVRVLDDLSTGRATNITGVHDVELMIGSLLDASTVRAALQDVRVVYNLACLGVRHSIHSPEQNHEVNAAGTLRLLVACREAGVERFVYTSSSEVYGTASRVPMSEDHPTYPHTVYGAAKLAGEAYTRAFYRTYGLPTVIVRPFNAYGPRSHHEGDSGEVIPKFIVRAMGKRPLVVFGDGSQTRDFTYVEDTAAGIALAGKSSTATGRTLNLAQGSEVSINELAATVLAVLNRQDLPVQHVAARPGDVHRLLGDGSSAREILGWTPKVDLWNGLQRLIEWHADVGTDWGDALKEDLECNWEALKS